MRCGRWVPTFQWQFFFRVSRMMQYVFPECWYLPSRVHGVIIQETEIWIFCPMKSYLYVTRILSGTVRIQGSCDVTCCWTSSFWRLEDCNTLPSGFSRPKCQKEFALWHRITWLVSSATMRTLTLADHTDTAWCLSPLDGILCCLICIVVIYYFVPFLRGKVFFFSLHSAWSNICYNEN